MDWSLNPEKLLAGYMSGLFPMADPEEENQVYWYAPDPRAIMPLDDFKTSRSLRARIRRGDYQLSTDRDFESIIRHCATRDDTWISEEIIAAYMTLYGLGYGHSIEVRKENRIVGGLYGVAIGGAFFGESMFSKKSDASKMALVHLVERLKVGGFVLLDIQFMTDHLQQFGAVEISKAAYERRLRQALTIKAVWN